MQILTISGRVGKTAELRSFGNDGGQFLRWSIAVDAGKDKQSGEKKTVWYDCVLFGKRAGSLDGYIKKGDALAVSGTPNVRVYEGKPYLGLSVDQLSFLGGNKSADNQSQGAQSNYGGGQSSNQSQDHQNGPQGGYGQSGGQSFDLDDNIPF